MIGIFIAFVALSFLVVILQLQIRKLIEQQEKMRKTISETTKTLGKIHTTTQEVIESQNDTLHNLADGMLNINQFVEVNRLSQMRDILVELFKEERFEKLKYAAKQYDEQRQVLLKIFNIKVDESAQDILEYLRGQL